MAPPLPGCGPNGTEPSAKGAAKGAAEGSGLSRRFVRVEPLGDPLLRTNPESLELERGVEVLVRPNPNPSSRGVPRYLFALTLFLAREGRRGTEEERGRRKKPPLAPPPPSPARASESTLLP